MQLPPVLYEFAKQTILLTYAIYPHILDVGEVPHKHVPHRTNVPARRSFRLRRLQGPTRLYVCKGGNGEVGGRGWKIGTQGCIRPHLCKTRKGGPATVTCQKRRSKSPP